MPGVSENNSYPQPIEPRRHEQDLVIYVTLIFQAIDFFKQHYNRMSDATRDNVITHLRLHVRHLYDIHFNA
jgi:hypothetical protein